MDNTSKPHTRSRRLHVIRAALLIVAALLLVIRFVGSPIVTSAVNRKLAALDGFTGRVEAIRLEPWRAGVTVKDLVLHERSFEEGPPLVHVEKATFSAAPSALVRGKLGGESLVERATFAVVKRRRFDGPLDAASEAAEKAERAQDEAKSWQTVLREAFPIEVTRFEIRDSRARFLDLTHEPKPEVAIEQLHVLVTGLTNRRKNNDDPLPMKMELTGVMTGNGRLKTDVQADPFATPLCFDVKFELRELSLPANNAFLQAYAGADVSRGTFELFLSANAKEGGYQGLVKPFLRDLDFKNVEDKNKNVGARIKESVINAASSLLKNDDTGKVATETPFSGTFEENEVELWSAVQNFLSNAFVRALKEGFQNETPSK